MSQTTVQRLPGTLPALIGGAWGLVCALALGGLRFALSEPPMRLTEWPGSIAFLAVYLAPFALALVALRWDNRGYRVAAWGAGSLLAVLASFSAFSGVSLVFLPAAPLLAIAALRAALPAGWRRTPVIVAGAGGLAAVGVVAFLALFAQQNDGRCWQLIRAADGQETWQEAPFSTSSALSASGVGAVQRLCSSDVISPLESGLSLGLLAAAGIGLWLLTSRQDSGSLDTAPVQEDGS